jgi:Tol biopolymer transport system component
MILRLVCALVVACALAGCTGTSSRGKVVFQSSRDGNFEIFSMNDDGSNVQRLTNSPAYDVSPSWSPDGSHILFASDRDGNWEIYIMGADGTNARRLTAPPGSNTAPFWAKGGTKIVFVSTRDAVNGEIYLMNADGSNVERLTRDSTVKDSPVMTPDGRSVVFTVNGRAGYCIITRDLSSGSQSALTPEQYNATSPRVSSDGSRILFAAAGNGFSGIYSMSTAGRGITRLTPAGIPCRTPAWGASVQEIVYSKNAGLYLLSLDTQKEIKLSTHGDSAPHWIKD